MLKIGGNGEFRRTRSGALAVLFVHKRGGVEHCPTSWSQNSEGGRHRRLRKRNSPVARARAARAAIRARSAKSSRRIVHLIEHWDVECAFDKIETRSNRQRRCRAAQRRLLQTHPCRNPPPCKSLAWRERPETQGRRM